MPTRISIRLNEFTTEVVGYCKESPEVVLKELISEYIIGYYLIKTCIPVDNYGFEQKHPSIIIEEVATRNSRHNLFNSACKLYVPYGLKVIGSLSQIMENRKRLLNLAKYSSNNIHFSLYRLYTRIFECYDEFSQSINYLKQNPDMQIEPWSLQYRYYMRAKINKPLNNIHDKLFTEKGESLDI